MKKKAAARKVVKVKLSDFDLVLGSSSPRRVELIAHLGACFGVVKPDIDESVLGKETPRAYAKRMAAEKLAVAWRLATRSKLGTGEAPRGPLVVVADTSVILSGKILGKPRNSSDACRMLATLSNRWHQVLSGVGIGTRDQHHIFLVTTRVKFGRLTQEQIKNYVASGEPMDKAGSYGAQGRGMCFVETIEGSYANVIGLPMADVVKALRSQFGIEI